MRFTISKKATQDKRRTLSEKLFGRQRVLPDLPSIRHFPIGKDMVRDAERGTVYLLSQDTAVDCGKVNSFELSLEVSIESYLHSRDDDVVLLVSLLDDRGRVAGLELLWIKLGQFVVARLLLESRSIESIG